MPGNLINKKSEVGRFSFEPTNPAFGFISRDFYREKLKSTVAICIIATVPLWRRWRDLNSRDAINVLLHFECSPFSLLGTSPCNIKLKFARKLREQSNAKCGTYRSKLPEIRISESNQRTNPTMFSLSNFL